MLLIYFAALAAQQSAGTIYASPTTGAKLAASCHQVPAHLEAGSELNHCTGYIVGSFDALSYSRRICPTPAANVNQVVAIARRYLNAHPARLNLHASRLLEDAFQIAFPCR